MGCCKIIVVQYYYIAEARNKKKIINLLNDNCKIKMDMTIELVSEVMYSKLALNNYHEDFGNKNTRMLTKIQKRVTSSFSITN